MHLNIQGMFSNINELKYVLRKRKPDFCLLSETHVTEESELNQLAIRGYDTYCCTSQSSHTGGVFVYINNKIKSKIVSMHKTHFSWCIAFEVRINNENIVIAVVYLSASENKNMILNAFEPWLEGISNECTVVCCGDFNINLDADTPYSRRLGNILTDNGLRQLVNKPTRVTQETSTLIDLCVTNMNSNLIKCEVSIEDQITDHRNIEVNILGRTNDIKVKKKCIQIWSEYSVRELWHSIEEWLPQWNHYVSKSVDEKTSWLLSNLKSSLGQFRKTIQISGKNDFYDNDLERMRCEKNRLYKVAQYAQTDESWKEYKVYKNIYKHKIQAKKYENTQRQLDRVAGNMKETWKVLNSLLNGNGNEVSSIKSGSTVVENDVDIANEFNNFFVNSICEINGAIPKMGYVNDLGNICDDTFEFQDVSIRDIKMCLKEMKNNTDEFNMNARNLMDCLYYIATPLADIINHSFRSGVFPSALKSATIIPIQKVVNTALINEFRPINMLPLLERLFEKLAYNQFNDYITRNNILKKHQSGFRGSHSCESAINDALCEWKAAQNDGKSVIAVFLDLQRAFETIEPEILIAKLRKLGV